MQAKDEPLYEPLIPDDNTPSRQSVQSRITPLPRGAARSMGSSPAYRAIEHILCHDHVIAGADSIRTIAPNASRFGNLLSCPFFCCGVRAFEVSKGKVRLVEDGSGNYEIYGPGVHRIWNMFASVGPEVTVNENITHGDRCIVTVNQGHIGYCEDMGQPVLLPPGLHEWQSQTLHFLKSVDLNNSIIPLGPFTVLTVDEGPYSMIPACHKLID